MKSIQEICNSLCREQYFDFRTPPLFNMKRLARGSFSVVYIHTDCLDVVTKIFRTSSNEGTVQYMHFCKKNAKNNPYLPKVYAIHEKGDFTAVVMERLSKDRDNADEWIVKVFNRGNDWSTIKVLKDADNNVRKAIRFLRKVIKTNTGHKFDFHGENILYRDGTQPVFTDPVYDTNTYQESRREVNY